MATSHRLFVLAANFARCRIARLGLLVCKACRLQNCRALSGRVTIVFLKGRQEVQAHSERLPGQARLFLASRQDETVFESVPGFSSE